jgi:AcrR family transcriptional regulator
VTTNGDPSTGLRLRNKLKRRDAILDAALVVLDDEAAASLTVDRVATLAELSPATVYNLVGGRDDVLRGVAVRFVERVRAEIRSTAETGEQSIDPLWMSRLALDRGTELLTTRSEAHRRLLSHLGGIEGGSILLTGTNGVPLQAADVHVQTMRHAQRQRVIRRNLDPVVLGTLVANTYIGTLLRWSNGGLADASLAPMCRLALVSVAASACTADHRAGFEKEINTLSRRLSTLRPQTIGTT